MMFGAVALGSAPLGAGGDGSIPVDYYEDITTFIPLESIEPLESSYISKHAKAFIDNQHANNDYALLALHQIFMFVAYGLLFSCLRRDLTIAEKTFTIAPVRREERGQLQQISSPFTLSLINERTFFDLMSVAGCDTSTDIPKLKKIIDDRNDLAHCNGKLCNNFEEDINKYIEGLEILHIKFAPITQRHLLDINKINFSVARDQQIDQLKNILSNNYISQRMIEIARPEVGASGFYKVSDGLLNYYLINEL